MDIGSWGLRAMRAAGVAVVMASLLVGCGGGDVPEGNEHVQYDGATLIVEGTPYERDTSIEEGGYTPSIIVMRDTGMGLLARAAERYGLEHVGYTASGSAVIKVPEGYEFSVDQGVSFGSAWRTHRWA